MSACRICFTDEERELLSPFAEQAGLEFEELIRRWTLERLKDELDARGLRNTVEESTCGATVPLDEDKILPVDSRFGSSILPAEMDYEEDSFYDSKKL